MTERVLQTLGAQSLISKVSSKISVLRLPVSFSAIPVVFFGQAILVFSDSPFKFQVSTSRAKNGQRKHHVDCCKHSSLNMWKEGRHASWTQLGLRRSKNISLSVCIINVYVCHVFVCV